MVSADMAIPRRSTARAGVLISLLALVAAACSSAAPSATPTTAPEPPAAVSIPNEGSTGEGHTPRGFPGTGTGLFVGDNLNPQFPDGDGVWTYMSFALPDNATVTSATLGSDVLQTRGTPFQDLGTLMVERVEYDEFSSELFDLPSSGDPTACTVIGGTAVACDVTGAVQAAFDDGATSVQFRLLFERPGDNDGEADLAMFYRSDSNTNEPGLFILQLNAVPLP